MNKQELFTGIKGGLDDYLISVPEDCYFATDIGSTETRTLAFDMELDLDEIIEVPAAYSEVYKDISHIKSVDNSLGSNLEIIVRDLTSSNRKLDKMFVDKRIVKGTLMDSLSLVPTMPSSKIMKSNQESTFINWIVSIALWSFVKSKEKNYCISQVNADVTIAMPPEDTKSKLNLEKIKKLFSGNYQVVFPRLNYSVDITVPEDKILIEDEASANIRFWSVESSEASESFSKNANVIVSDAGGRSHDVGLLRNGVLVIDAGKTGSFGGTNKFPQLIASAYAETHMYEPPHEDILSALDTGIASDAARTDYTEYIKNAKSELAKLVWNDLLYIMDKAGLMPQQIHAVVLSGGLYKETVRDNNIVVASLANNVRELFEKVSPRTTVELISGEYPIIYGLAYYRISQE